MADILSRRLRRFLNGGKQNLAFLRRKYGPVVFVHIAHESVYAIAAQELFPAGHDLAEGLFFGQHFVLRRRALGPFVDLRAVKPPVAHAVLPYVYAVAFGRVGQ